MCVNMSNINLVYDLILIEIWPLLDYNSQQHINITVYLSLYYNKSI